MATFAWEALNSRAHRNGVLALGAVYPVSAEHTRSESGHGSRSDAPTLIRVGKPI